MSDSNTLAIVAVSVSGAIGFLGLASTLFTSWKDRTGALTLAREERQQARLADTYLALLELTEKGGAWAQMVLPVMDTIPPAPDPPSPDLDTELSVRARVAAYGSDDVRAAIKVWEQSLREVRAKVWLVRFRRGQADEQGGRLLGTDDSDWSTPWMELETTARPAELAARSALQDSVARELR